MGEKKVRSFVALEIPPALQERLAALQAELRRARVPARWVRPEGIHLTLKFLGELAAPRLAAAAEALREAAAGTAAFGLRAGGVGVFPDLRRPRVLWVGVEDESGCLEPLVRRLEAAFARRGFPPEGRPFRAHLTLGRFREPDAGGTIAQALGRFRDFALGEVPAEAMVLYRSELLPEGARYHEIARCAFEAVRKTPFPARPDEPGAADRT
ncbi:MAG: RNA 2',3'-cyclic phosphodiesterase [Desulfobacterales bacterium]